MLFNSWIFPLFLAVVFVLYWATSRAGFRVQNVLLLVASYVFYGWWDYRFLSLIFISSSVDYVVGRWLGAATRTGFRRALLGLSLATNLGLLGFFKYFDFFVQSAAELLRSLGLHADPRTLNIVLPVGISFYTFQTLSYTIDIYRKRIGPTRDLIAFFAFVSFFPQLVAGPIERARSLLPQFLRPRRFDAQRATDGLRQILWGFFKKVVIADNVAGHVDTIFAMSPLYNGLTLYLGVVLFAFQIYCDFSGYSDIAIGTGRLFGFSLMRNFAYPYFSRNIAEFWRRWHISLSSWFRDYVYIPLGGSRAVMPRRILNVIVTFTVSGFWHGAEWTFVVWGLLHGLYYIPLMVGRSHKKHVDTPAEGRLLPGLREFGAIVLTFYATLIAWVFFRADSLPGAFSYVRRLLSFDLLSGGTIDLVAVQQVLGYIVVLVGVEWVQRHRQHALAIDGLSRPVRWIVYLSVALAVAFLGNFGEIEFIYFQF